MALRIEVLDKTFNRDAFDCGIPALNDFLKTKARQAQEKNFNKTMVLFDDKDKEKHVLGYYSVSMSEVSLEILPESQRRGLPKHPVPVARVGRLAVDNSTKGKGYGALLLVDVLKRVKGLSREIGVFAVVVDAKDDAAKGFYIKHGFIPFEVQTMSLFLPILSIP